jgi:hypothetical protein
MVLDAFPRTFLDAYVVGVVGNMLPGPPGQGPRGIDSTQGQTYPEVVIPQLPPKAKGKKRHVSDSTASSAR